MDDKISTSVGEYTTIGHNCIIHGCNIGSYSLIGMGSIILNGAVIGNNCIIGAGTLITQNSEIPDNSLVFGSPGKIIRTITNDEKNILICLDHDFNVCHNLCYFGIIYNEINLLLRIYYILLGYNDSRSSIPNLNIC